MKVEASEAPPKKPFKFFNLSFVIDDVFFHFVQGLSPFFSTICSKS